MLTDLQKRAAQAIVNVFETGSPRGNHSSVTVIPGDAGRLTYGRTQATLASGALHQLIKAYCECPEARYGRQLRGYLGRLAACDHSLDRDAALHSLLRAAGADPAMQAVQERFFERRYWCPAVATAAGMGLSTALGVAVVYDGRVHGSWQLLRNRTTRKHGTARAVGERSWLRSYVAERRAWLASRAEPLCHAVYRMDAFRKLMDEDNWDLHLPFSVRGVVIDAKALEGVCAAHGLQRSSRR